MCNSHREHPSELNLAKLSLTQRHHCYFLSLDHHDVLLNNFGENYDDPLRLSIYLLVSYTKFLIPSGGYPQLGRDCNAKIILADADLFEFFCCDHWAIDGT